MFKDFFNQHPNSDLKVYRLAREKGDGSFERLLAKALEDADQFKGRAKELLYDCFVEDLAGFRGNDKREHETLYAILVGKIGEHRRNSNAQGRARPETEFFDSIEAMEKALAAARHAGLINEAGKWSFTGHRTHAVSLFWIAAIAAGLAKPSAPVSKVSPFLAELLNVPLGVNAVNKKKKAEDYDLGTDDTVFQRLYNELLTQMGKISP